MGVCNKQPIIEERKFRFTLGPLDWTNLAVYRKGRASVKCYKSQLLSEVLKRNIPHQCGNRSDSEVRTRNDIFQGERQALPTSVRNGKLSHQEI